MIAYVNPQSGDHFCQYHYPALYSAPVQSSKKPEKKYSSPEKWANFYAALSLLGRIRTRHRSPQKRKAAKANGLCIHT